MKITVKILSVVLVLAMCFAFVACGTTPPPDNGGNNNGGNNNGGDNNGGNNNGGNNNGGNDYPADPVDKYADIEDYDELSAAIYEDVLGDFYAIYAEAKAETTNISRRYALMAIAEAKLLEASVMIPLQTQGGNYAVSRVAPYTVGYANWGNDSDRFHQAIVCTEPITTVDRDALKALWAEKRGSGEYEDACRSYLKGHGYTIKDSYSLAYSSDPKTWDAVATSRAVDSEAIVNTYDGLVEYDVEGTMKPALATSWSVSDDGLTYTFNIREGVKWVDSQGREVGTVTADDFVAGFQHMLDARGGLEYLVQGVVVNADEYIHGEVEFSEVGVKAVDTYTLTYTLAFPASYFPTMLTYNCFAPMNRAYYESKGGKFGADYDPSAETYTYGTDPENIAYCGPYVVSSIAASSTIVFSANPSYWNKDGINIKTITWLFNDGQDTTKGYNDMKAGTIDGAGLNSSTVELAKTDGIFDTHVYISSTNATSIMAFFNLYRAQFGNVGDETAVPSTQTAADQLRTKVAMQNLHFRRALSFSLDRASYNEQSVGEALKLNNLRNSYTPGNFVSLEEDVTVKINGTDTTFPAGTMYGVIMQAQLDADNSGIKAYDPTADGGAGSSDGYDGWYNPEKAAAELAIAIEELAAQGVAISADNPIYLDLPCYTGSDQYLNRGNALKQSVEEATGGKIIINLTECPTGSSWYNAGYYTDYGYEANYDIYDVSGWGPDYGDPSTYLDTFLPEYAGYMVKCLGIF